MTRPHSTPLVLVVAVLALIGSTVLAIAGTVDGSEALAIYALVAGYAFGKVQPQPSALTRRQADR